MNENILGLEAGDTVRLTGSGWSAPDLGVAETVVEVDGVTHGLPFFFLDNTKYWIFDPDTDGADWSVTVVKRKNGTVADVDLVNRPPHYTRTRFEVIEVLEEFFSQDPHLWQVGKYIMRAGHKDDEIQDLQKARYYLDRKIQRLQEAKALT